MMFVGLALVPCLSMAMVVVPAQEPWSRLRKDSVVLGLPLSRGAFGTVHWANIDGRRVVAKRAVLNDATAASYLRVEAEMNSRAHQFHQGSCHLAPFIGVCSIGGVDHLVWEACLGVHHSLDWYLSGGWLRELAHDLGVDDEDSSQGFKQLLDVLMNEMLAALTLVHSDGILHRDIKPENWLVDARTHSLRLIDFGSACDAAVSQQPHLMPATAAYAPPELRLIPDVPWSYDVYSVASVWLRFVAEALSVDFDRLREDWSSQCDQGTHIQTPGGRLELSERMSRLIPRLLAPDPHARVSASEALGCSRLREPSHFGDSPQTAACEQDFSCRLPNEAEECPLQ